MSERVLHEWTDSESIIRIVEDDRGFFGWSAESGIVTDLIPIVFCKELARLAARVSELEADIQLITAPAESTGGVFLALKSRVSELELDREGRIRSSDYDKARIEELEAENAKLRKCVEAADSEINAWREWGARISGDERVCGWVHQEDYGLYCLLADPPVSGIPYDAARAEVDK